MRGKSVHFVRFCRFTVLKGKKKTVKETQGKKMKYQELSVEQNHIRLDRIDIG